MNVGGQRLNHTTVFLYSRIREDTTQQLFHDTAHTLITSTPVHHQGHVSPTGSAKSPWT